MGRLLLPLILSTAAAWPQSGPGCCGPGMGPVTGAPLVEFEGKIVQVRIAPGQGMPSIAIKTADGETSVLLGPLWYLMAQDFNPKVGDEVAGKAYKTTGIWIGSTVTLRQSKKTLRLREDDGRPAWRGARR